MNKTQKFILALIIFVVGSVIYHTARSDNGMAICQRTHSYATCFTELNR